MSNLSLDILHLFSGIGGGALGFQKSEVKWREMQGKFHTLAGIDSDPLACQDFENLTGAPAHCMDLFGREDYIAFHGHEPPAGWKEVQPDDLRNTTKGIAPDVVFTSPPCKGFSGLLPEKSAKSAKYQALNNLTVRGIFLTLEAYRDNLPGIIMLENVPRIRTRGTKLLNTIKGLLTSYGYVICSPKDEVHDCGEIGGLAQHRKRYLLIARHPSKISAFVYQPPKQRVRALGEIIGPLPMPDDLAAGPLHRLPKLQWKTWVRLALIPAGGDWRDLENINPEHYRLEYVPRGGGPYGVKDFSQPGATVIGNAGVKGSNAAAIADPRLKSREGRHACVYQVTKFEDPANTVTGTRFGSGAPAIADNRIDNFANSYRISKWDKPAGTVTSGHAPSNGGTVIADPRTGFKESTHGAIYRVSPWEEPTNTVTGAHRPNNGALTIADPRLTEVKGRFPNKYQMHSWDGQAATITGSTDIQSGAPSITDPRLGCNPRNGTMGVQDWDKPGATVIGSADIHAGASALADPRVPKDNESGNWIIISLDGTWHRPLTAFELAMIQSFPTTMPDGRPLTLAGKSDARWREAIGNAVPPDAGQAMGNAILMAVLPSIEGTWVMGTTGIWVMPGSEELVHETI